MKKQMIAVSFYYVLFSTFLGLLIGAPILFIVLLAAILSYFTYVIAKSMNEAYLMDLAMGENNTHINVKMRAGVYLTFLFIYLFLF